MTYRNAAGQETSGVPAIAAVLVLCVVLFFAWRSASSQERPQIFRKDAQGIYRPFDGDEDEDDGDEET